MKQIFDINTLAGRMKKLRKEKGLSLAALAKEIGVTPQSLSLYENADRTPSADVLYNLAAYFHVSVDYLVGTSDCPSPQTSVQAICRSTGLSAEAVKRMAKLKEVHIGRGGTDGQMCENKVSTVDVINGVILDMPITFFFDVSELQEASTVCEEKSMLFRSQRMRRKLRIALRALGIDIQSEKFQEKFEAFLLQKQKENRISDDLTERYGKKAAVDTFSDEFRDKCDLYHFRIAKSVERFLDRYDARQPIDEMSVSEFLEYLGITDEDIEFLRECITDREEENHVQHPQTNE